MKTSGDIGFCPYAGHSGSVILIWGDNKVASVECSFGNHESCGYADNCELYQRKPVGFTQSRPANIDS